MLINEENNLSTNNTKTSSLGTDNTATSDETKTNFDYVSGGKTVYARNKKIRSTTKTIGIIATILLSALLGGTLIGNTFIGSLPSVSDVSFTGQGNTIVYAFTVKNDTGKKLYLLVTENGEEILRNDVSLSNTYQDTLTGLSYSTQYQVSLQATNGVDFRKNIYSVSVTTGDSRAKSLNPHLSISYDVCNDAIC
ncbi:MAG: hypothetical protein LKM30_06470 [Bacilli bacterium]|jgi:hypothetical protein|nr:hypothetical protein [Bacilli bacterium]